MRDFGRLLAYVHGVTSEIIDERKAQEVAEAMRVSVAVS